MKRKNLFLSLICSLILTVALVTVTVLSIVPKKDNGAGGNTSSNVSDTGNTGDTQTPDVTINEDRDGSAEKPYVIYDAETFETFIVGKYLDENGEYIDYLAEDGEGNLLYPELAEGLYYELAADIDFAGQDVKPMFNKGIAFNGHIDGKDFALKNISMNVTKANLVEDYTFEKDEQMIANIGIFGEVYQAEIKGLKVEGFAVTCEEGLYEYIWNAGFETGTMKSLTVGAVAGIAYDSTIEATVDAKLDAFAYAVYSQNKANGSYAVGGVVGVASGCAINDTTAVVEIIVDEGHGGYVGGVVGAALDTTFTNITVEADVKTYTKLAYDIGGMIGYANTVTVDIADVKISVADIEEVRLDTDGITSIDADKYTSIAGIIAVINVKENDDISTVANVKVISSADIDATFAGAVMDVVVADALASSTEKYVELKDIIVDSNVNVLKAFGFAKYLVNTKIELTQTQQELVDKKVVEYNIKITGKASLDRYFNGDVINTIPVELFMTMERSANNEIVGGKASVKIIASSTLAVKASQSTGGIFGFGELKLV